LDLEEKPGEFAGMVERGEFAVTMVEMGSEK
jgi:hypothetical protein